VLSSSLKQTLLHPLHLQMTTTYHHHLQRRFLRLLLSDFHPALASQNLVFQLKGAYCRFLRSLSARKLRMERIPIDSAWKERNPSRVPKNH
jgi:hypothetical protein